MRDRLLRALEESPLTKTQLARMVGVGQSAVSQWFSGNTKSISSEHIFAVARALEVSPEWLATGRGPMRLKFYNSGVKTFDAGPKVPVLSWNMANDWERAEDRDAISWTQRISGGPNTFVLSIDGRSMVGSDRAFSPGELIHVDPDQQDVAPGDFVVASVGGNVVFRQLMSDSGSPYLHALNPQFPEIFEDFRIIGRVVARSESL